MPVKQTVVCALVACAALFWTCDTSDPDDNGPTNTCTPCVPDASKDLALTNPLGCETFNVGDTVMVTWTASDAVKGVRVYVSDDGGKNPQLIVTRQVEPDSSFMWIIGQEPVSLDYPSTEVEVMIDNYVDEGMYDITCGPISVE